MYAIGPNCIFHTNINLRQRKSIKVKCSNDPILPKIVESKSENNITSIVNETTPNILEYIEKVNGRCAMQGFMWGSINYLQTGNSISDQLVHKNNYGYEITNNCIYMISIIALITLGTTMTTVLKDFDSLYGLYNKSLELAPNKFSSDVEILHCRLAMIGIVFLYFLIN